MSDPRKAKTLDEACANGDGTYNGIKLLSWLSAAVGSPRGFAGFSEAEVAEEWEKAKANKQLRDKGVFG